MIKQLTFFFKDIILWDSELRKTKTILVFMRVTQLVFEHTRVIPNSREKNALRRDSNIIKNLINYQ